MIEKPLRYIHDHQEALDLAYKWLPARDCAPYYFKTTVLAVAGIVATPIVLAAIPLTLVADIVTGAVEAIFALARGQSSHFSTILYKKIIASPVQQLVFAANYIFAIPVLSGKALLPTKIYACAQKAVGGVEEKLNSGFNIFIDGGATDQKGRVYFNDPEYRRYEEERNKIPVFHEFPLELVERLLKESGNFDTSLITKDWSQLASINLANEGVWQGFAIKLGQSHLIGQAEPGKLHTVLGKYCTFYTKLIEALPEATPDVKALARGPLNLEVMLKLQEWKANRDKIVIMRQMAMATQRAIPMPDMRKLSSIEVMIEEGRKFSLWFDTNLNSLHKLMELRLPSLKLTSLPEEIGQLKNLRRLRLEQNNLSSLPGMLGQLKNLRTLHLEQNNLSSLPGMLGQLEKLQELYLEYNQLTILPLEIGQLKNLQVLEVQRNQLTSLPATIGQLKNLGRLEVKENQLSVLPEDIGQLKNLQVLEVQSNQLTSLPATIGQLEKLQQLYLGDNQLTILPTEIWQLKNLRRLEVMGNQLSVLPEYLGQLEILQEHKHHLEYMYRMLSRVDRAAQASTDTWLGGIQFRSLPEAIGQLEKLQELYLGYNQLTLPTEIWQLKNLRRLEVMGNQLSVLPEDIDQLKNLKTLEVGNNQLTVPPETGHLENLQKLTTETF